MKDNSGGVYCSSEVPDGAISSSPRCKLLELRNPVKSSLSALKHYFIKVKLIEKLTQNEFKVFILYRIYSPCVNGHNNNSLYLK